MRTWWLALLAALAACGNGGKAGTSGKGGAMGTGGIIGAGGTTGGTIPALAVLAGLPNGMGNADGVGTTARFNMPYGVTVDAAGNLFVTDTGNDTVRKITPSGVVSTVAGSAGLRGSEDGIGAVARFHTPLGVTVDGAGDLFIADHVNYTIRKVTPAGEVTTLAGTAGSFGSANGSGAVASFNAPSGVAVDGVGNLFVVDDGNGTIRKVTPAGEVTTFAGTAGLRGSADGAGAAASFNAPSGVAVDGAGNLFVADAGNNTIRKVTPAGVVTTLAGTAGLSGSADGAGAAARFNNPSGVAVDGEGNLFVADTLNRAIRKITPSGVVTTLADGTGAPASFGGPTGVAVDGEGNVFVAGNLDDTIRKITPAGMVTTLAGSATDSGSADGTGAAARLNNPDGVAVDEAGNVFVADRANNTIRRITPAGVVTTLAGSATAYSGSADGTGTAASFDFPCGVAVDGAGNLFVVDSFNDTIRMVTSAGIVTTLAGSAGSLGSADGAGAAARFDRPQGVAVDGAGNLFVADMGNDTIRKVAPSGVVATLAGSATAAPGSADGTGGDAHFNRPQGVAMDGAGNLFVTDTGNGTIRKVTPAGVVTTFAGTAGLFGSADGIGADARFSAPHGLAVDRAGNVFVADCGNNAIRKITPAGAVTTVVGVAAQTSVGNLPGPFPASIVCPNGVAIDSSGTMLYITLADAVMVAVLPN